MTGLPWDDPSSRRAPLSADDLDELVDVANELADAASGPAVEHFRARPDVEDKDAGSDATTFDHTGFDPVTVADRATEQAMRDLLATCRPDDGIVGEEHGHSPGASGLTWVLDPIDGTRAWIAGLPTWCVLVAVFDGVEPVVGVIDQPWIGERWVGVATPDRRWAHLRRPGLDGRADVHELDVAGVPAPPTLLPDAVLHTTFPEVGSEQERAAFERVRDRVRLTRYGADAYAYGLVATGTIDVVVEAGLAPWDVQALVPVLRGAGRAITAWDGGPPHHGGRVVASGNDELHRQVRRLLHDEPEAAG